MEINYELKLLVNNEADMLHFIKMKSGCVLHSFGMFLLKTLRDARRFYMHLVWHLMSLVNDVVPWDTFSEAF